MKYSLEDLLDAMTKYGSAAKAAAALDLSKEAISKRFRKLPDDHPLKVDYMVLCGKQGRPRQYADTPEGTRLRMSKAWATYKQKHGKRRFKASGIRHNEIQNAAHADSTADS